MLERSNLCKMRLCNIISNMRSVRLSFFARMLAFVPLTGCGAFLSANTVGTDDLSGSELPGVVVNSHTIYKIDYKVEPNFGDWKLSVSSNSFVAIDHQNRLSVNAWRMPFAGGTLMLNLHENQSIKKVGVTGKTSGERGPKSLSAITEARMERSKIEYEAKQAAADAASDGEQE